MASPTDRMAAGAGFGALAKADELKKRLVVYSWRLDHLPPWHLFTIAGH